MASRIWHSLGWRRRLLLLALPVVLAGAGLLVVILFFPSPSAPAATAPPAPNSQAADALPGTGGLLVEVTGAVARPGLYRVAKGERVYAAIAAAGGFTADADSDRLPALAARLRDGQQIRVPSRRTPAGGRTTRTASRVSLNSASAEELAAVPGFTAELAAAAVRYRSEYGGFRSTRELVTVLEMSEADYQLARRYLTT
jgi:competence protein ComEA